ncbi:unnamed protein product [Brassica oleracea var. botrytis]|uniref:Uncharacterized protein n=2 Tax=Brassica TaxID=3705 RepID=A0A3P6E1U7_BRAOL|nr:unnamed protein product [Brassica napus]CDY65787.1 BnaC02g48260D [Brassica napus]VDD26582.1 unnamed protein product [Brassica oleracea]
MEFVFGSTFVCKTTDVAKEVGFNRNIQTPTVTLEDDIFQPSDLLTGGSRKYVILSIVFCHYHVFTKMMLGCKVRH